MLRIVFFGTPEFAVPSLRALVGEGFDPVAVVTQPDRAQGRSRSSLLPPPVKLVAQEENIPVLQPETPADPAFQAELRQLAPELGVVVAYGHILKPDVLSIPSRGMINVHASLLPQLRGAAPIQHAIMEGLTETGVSVMQMEAGMDTGPVLLRVATPIAADETGGELSVRLAELGALALVEALALMGAGEVLAEVQDGSQATYAPKLTRERARIDWTTPAERVARLIRALDPKPGAWSTVEGKEVKLFGARAVGAGNGAQPGTVLGLEPRLIVAAAAGTPVELLEVQPSGGERISTTDWARGRGVRAGQRFE